MQLTGSVSRNYKFIKISLRIMTTTPDKRPGISQLNVGGQVYLRFSILADWIFADWHTWKFCDLVSGISATTYVQSKKKILAVRLWFVPYNVPNDVQGADDKLGQFLSQYI